MNDLKKEYEYFQHNKDELMKKYKGRAIAIVGEAVVGDYPDKQTAFRDQAKKREVGSFLVQSCDPNEEPWVFHSRVA